MVQATRHFRSTSMESGSSIPAPRKRSIPEIILRWKLGSRPEAGVPFISDVQPARPPASVPADQLRVTMVNHSTVLLQQSGVQILTDPIWSQRASPLSWIGPHRRRGPGVRWDDLPHIDVVLLSHNHYDHLDLATLRVLADRKQSRFIVPLGVARLLAISKYRPAARNGLGRLTAAP